MQRNLEHETVDIIKHPPSPETLRTLCRKLGVRPSELLRKRDPAFEAHDLGSGRHSDQALLELMSANPGLIQRPIVVRGRRAVVARPTDAIETLL